ncbi:MAG: hypothetical protein ACRDE8_07175 [Ginsengibacter sp.]
MNKITLSYMKATELVELKEAVPLSNTRKIQLKMHIALCPCFKNYLKQPKPISKLLYKNFSSLPLNRKN